jgi:hypothetical protein
MISQIRCRSCAVCARFWRVGPACPRTQRIRSASIGAPQRALRPIDACSMFGKVDGSILCASRRMGTPSSKQMGGLLVIRWGALSSGLECRLPQCSIRVIQSRRVAAESACLVRFAIDSDRTGCRAQASRVAEESARYGSSITNALELSRIIPVPSRRTLLVHLHGGPDAHPPRYPGSVGAIMVPK